MIIAVNTRLLLPGKIEGIGRFAQETLRIITREHPEHRFIFIFDRKYSEEFVFSDNITPVVTFPPARHPLLWYGFFEWGVPQVLKKYKADLFFSPDGWLSLRSPVISLPVIHDLNFFAFPEFIPYPVRKYYHYYFPKFIGKAARIATVSSYTKNDIVSRFNYPANQMDVVYNGASQAFLPLEEADRQRVRDTYTRGCPYFLFVGLIHPRKNLANLIRAYDMFKKYEHSNIKLLVVGERKWWTQDMEQAYDSFDFKDDIIFAGRKNDDELGPITASALGMVYVSHFEGFGIPVLESMCCDVPVICSSTTSLPEVGGDAVIYADPSHVDSIASAMIRLYKEPGLSQSLIEKARLQREKFSWEKTARLLWESIEKCLKA
ncbi:MAG: glycosyltransferase family 1 protein [Bacteroidales bacterium]